MVKLKNEVTGFIYDSCHGHVKNIFTKPQTQIDIDVINMFIDEDDVLFTDNEDINNRLMIGNNPYIIEITSLDNKKNYRIGYTFFENDMIEVDEYYRKESVIYFSNYDNLKVFMKMENKYSPRYIKNFKESKRNIVFRKVIIFSSGL